MKIIFHDISTDLMTLFAVQLYLNLKKEPKFKKIKRLALVKQGKCRYPVGTIVYLGKDYLNNSVFIMARKKEQQIVCKALRGLNRVLKFNNKFIFYDLNPYRNLYLQLAAVLKCIHILPGFVQQISFYGIRKEFNKLTRDLEKFHNKIKEKTGEKK